MGISRRNPLSIRHTLKKPSFPKPLQNGDVGPDASDWRAQMGRDARQRVVNRIIYALKRHIPPSDQVGLNQLTNIAVRFEERTLAAATSQPDYLREIATKLLTVDLRCQQAMPNCFLSNNAGSGNSPPCPGSGME